MTKQLFIYLVLLIRLGFLAILAHQAWHHDWTGVFVAAQALVISFLPNLLKKFFGIHTPFALRVGTVLFMFATLILGEIADFYNTFWWWDLILHGAASVGLALIAFITLLIFFTHIDLRPTALFASVLAVGLAVSVGVLWELYEFIIDSLFATDTPMQPSNTDTMTDLAVTVAGALLVGVSGYRYIKWRSKGVMGRIIHDGATRNSNAWSSLER